MGVKHKIYILLLILIIALTGCRHFNSSDINMAGISLADIRVHSSAAYYLSEEGILYSLGADGDSSSYVLYKNSKKGIVAENVKTFGEMTGGGYYISNSDELYIWNRNVLPLYNYNYKDSHKMILQDVKYVAFESYFMVYIDKTNNLYLAGEFGEKSYSIEQSQLLGNDVTAVDVEDSTVIWAQNDGTIKSYGDIEIEKLDISKVQESLNTSKIESILLECDKLFVLQEGNLWFCGNYENLITGSNNTNGFDVILLKQDIINVSSSINTVAGIDSQGAIYIWGKCLSNSLEDTKNPHYDYYEGYKAAIDAKSVYVSDGCFCYVDNSGNSKIFHANGPDGFYGNSTKDVYVGINREPVMWVDY